MFRMYYDVAPKDWSNLEDVDTLKHDYEELEQMYNELDDLISERDRAYENAADIHGDYTEYNDICDRIYDLYHTIQAYQSEIETIVEDMRDALEKVVDIAYQVNYEDIRA